MQRYAKYREKIRRMPERDFPASEPEPSQEAEPEENIADIIGDASSKGPYSYYFKRKLKYYLIVGGFFLLAVVGFLIWYFLFLGRN